MASRLSLLFLAVVVGVLWANANTELPQALSKSMIDYINDLPGNTWKAGKNLDGRTLSDYKKLCGSLESADKLPTRYHTIDGNEIFPESFDPREKWPHCPTLYEIRDQGPCGSCWAFGAVSAISDRICIATNGKVQAHLSAEDVLRCCFYCGFGCYGGYPPNAWRFYHYNGIVTGGGFASEEGCLPYSIPPIPKAKPPHNESFQIFGCDKKCREGYGRSYFDDKHYALDSYSLPSKKEQIMKELLQHGPIEVSFSVYEDFLSYKSGVYHHVTGGFLGGHAVKLLGWGVENGTNYWLLANSWGTKWGDNGFFKMIQGKNECGIEKGGVAGTPKEIY